MDFVAYAVLLLFAVLILAIDLFSATTLIAGLILAGRLSRRRAVTVVGHVVEIERRRPGDGSARVRVAYETAAGTFEITGRSHRPMLGEPMTVRYDPANPARATTVLRIGRTVAIGIPVVVVFGALAVGMITGAVLYFAGRDRHLQGPLGIGCLCLTFTFGLGFTAWRKFGELRRWGCMVPATGTVIGFEEHSPDRGSILISFDSADGREEFRARAGSVLAGIGDKVTVHYDPDTPARTATILDVAGFRAQVIATAVCALIFAVGTVVALIHI
jgi:hypothetical protein